MAFKINNKVESKTLIQYCPHGINSKTFFPYSEQKDFDAIEKKKKELFKDKEYDFIVFYNNRNIRRKQTSDVMLAFRVFCESLTKEKSDKCLLLMHTHPVDEAGTDLIATRDAVCPQQNILFSTGRASEEEMNLLYNMVDVTINMASNEGFGLGTAESVMSGTPIIVTVTGGLQDQCGFLDDNGKPIVFTEEWGSNHDGRYKTHGEWVVPLYPVKRILQGSVPTPYIFDDHSDWVDGAKAIKKLYLLGREERKRRGLIGRNWMINGDLNSKNMCQTFIDGMEATFNNWVPRPKFSLHTADEFVGHSMPNGNMGIIMPKID